MHLPVIVAPATPAGRSALAVVRFSGPDVLGCLASVVRPLHRPLRSGRHQRVALHDQAGCFDDGMAVYVAGPATYTGEDTLEVTLHGNPMLVERLLHAAVEAGARLAGPGELTRRAVLHGKLDLVQAEGVDQVIRATSETGLRIGRAALDGSLLRFLEPLRLQLLGCAAELEARLDYPGDELAHVDDGSLTGTLVALSQSCRDLASTERAGRALVEGARVALVGPVNAGKSSLFNALLGRRRALVHERPGTTRDVLEARTRIGDIDLTLLDTAGERETDDPVEAAGLALARDLVSDADLLLVVLRARPEMSEIERTILARTTSSPRVVVYNGVDQPDAAPPPPGALSTSAITGDGLSALKGAICRAIVGDAPRSADRMIASARQRDLLDAVADALDEAVDSLPTAGAAVAADSVVRALEELDALTGADTREEVLDALFARFCIGK